MRACCHSGEDEAHFFRSVDVHDRHEHVAPMASALERDDCFSQFGSWTRHVARLEPLRRQAHRPAGALRRAQPRTGRTTAGSGPDRDRGVGCARSDRSTSARGCRLSTSLLPDSARGNAVGTGRTGPAETSPGAASHEASFPFSGARRGSFAPKENIHSRSGPRRERAPMLPDPITTSCWSVAVSGR